MGIFRQFPYSNFHEMNMDVIIKIMREMQDEWSETKDDWASYKDFIDNYFNTLDVSAEVLAALRIFAADGTLNTIMDPVIASETASWLAEHITVTEGSTVIDDSLSIQGAAADAKATGDAINNLKSDLTNYNSNDIWLDILKEQNTLPSNLTHSGVLYRYNEDGSASISGTATGSSFRNIFYSDTELPDGLTAGKTYYLTYGSDNVGFRIRWVFESGADPAGWTSLNSANNVSIKIPDNAIGCYIRYFVNTGITVNETVHPVWLTAYSNQYLTESIENMSDQTSYNSSNIWLDIVKEQNTLPADVTSSGIRYQYNEDGSASISGTATVDSFRNIFYSNTELPDGLTAGEEYYLTYDSDNVWFRIRWVFEAGADPAGWTSLNSANNVPIKIPDDAIGCYIRYFVVSGTTVNETVHPVWLTAYSNQYLTENIRSVEPLVVNEPVYTYPSSGHAITTPVANAGIDLKILSYNVARYNKDSQAYLSDKQIFAFRNMLMDIDADIIGVQEDSEYIDSSSTKLSNDYLYYPKYQYKNGTGGVTIHSKQPVRNVDLLRYSTNRYLRYEFIDIDNKTLLVISTHPTPGATANNIASRNNEYQELFKWIYQEITLNSDSTGNPVTCGNWDYCIITGDFNSDTDTDRTNLLNYAAARGFTCANGGYLGWIPTCYSGSMSGEFVPLDNILCSENIIINDIKVYTKLYDKLHSDHVPVAAKVTLI